jgi:hypothetical protein
MSKWGMACCRDDGEPLISTFEFRGFEFICAVCGTKYGFLEPVGKPETPELEARYEELRAHYKAERAARAAEVSS